MAECGLSSASSSDAGPCAGWQPAALTVRVPIAKKKENLTRRSNIHSGLQAVNADVRPVWAKLDLAVFGPGVNCRNYNAGTGAVDRGESGACDAKRRNRSDAKH